MLIDNLLKVFSFKYNELIDDINSRFFGYVNDFVSKKIDYLNDEVDYSTTEYKLKLVKILEELCEAGVSLNIEKEKLLRYLLDKYVDFPPYEEFTTYIDWVKNDFEYNFQFLIFDEILAYLIQQPSDITVLKGLKIVSEENIEELNKIMNEEPRLLIFIGWYENFKDLLMRKVNPQQLDPDVESILKFSSVKKDIQSYMLGFKIARLAKLDKIFDFKELHDTLTTSDEWLENPDDLDERYALPLYSGIYLARYLGIGVNGTIVKKKIQEELLNLVNNVDWPLLNNTFMVDYILRSCNLMGLNLTDKLINGLTRLPPHININALNSYSTAKLSGIIKILAKYDKLEKYREDMVKFVSVLDDRMVKGLYKNLPSDLSPTCSGIYHSFQLFKNNKTLHNFPLKKSLTFIRKYLEDNLYMFDFGLSSQLSELFFGFKFMNDLLELIIEDKIEDKSLRTYPLSIDLAKESEERMIEEKIYEEERLMDEIGGYDGSATTDESATAPATSVRKARIPRSQQPYPTVYPEFFGNFPVLNPEITDKLSINFEPLQNPPESIFGDLKILFQTVICQKILNIHYPYTSTEILQKTSSFRKTNGFIRSYEKGSNGDAGMFVDPEYTFYGLCIYAEFDLLDELDLDVIEEYLRWEAANFYEKAHLTNFYIFNSMRLLSRFDPELEMIDYQYLLAELLNFDLEVESEEFSLITNMLNITLLIQSIDPAYIDNDVSEIYSHTYLKVVENNGSIDNLPVSTAKSLIALKSLRSHEHDVCFLGLEFLATKIKMFDETIKGGPLDWNTDEILFANELNMAYWILNTLAVYYPNIL